MRVVATSDTHYTVDINAIPDGDVFMHAGDLCRTGYPDDWKLQLEWLAALPHKTKVFVPGNHDFHLQVYPGPALQDLYKIGVKCIGLPGNPTYAQFQLPNGMRMLGLPFVTNLPKWAFNSSEEELEKYLKQMGGGYDIIVSHAPPRFCLDEVGGKNVGIAAYWEYALEHRPAHWIFGHIHECYGNETKALVPTQFHNVAMCNRQYTHANAPLILDL